MLLVVFSYTNSDGTDVASIRAHRESANDDVYLGSTRNTGGSITEKLRITSDGNIYINHSSILCKLTGNISN